MTVIGVDDNARALRLHSCPPAAGTPGRQAAARSTGPSCSTPCASSATRKRAPRPRSAAAPSAPAAEDDGGRPADRAAAPARRLHRARHQLLTAGRCGSSAGTSARCATARARSPACSTACSPTSSPSRRPRACSAGAAPGGCSRGAAACACSPRERLRQPAAGGATACACASAARSGCRTGPVCTAALRCAPASGSAGGELVLAGTHLDLEPGRPPRQRRAGSGPGCRPARSCSAPTSTTSRAHPPGRSLARGLEAVGGGPTFPARAPRPADRRAAASTPRSSCWRTAWCTTGAASDHLALLADSPALRPGPDVRHQLAGQLLQEQARCR